MSALETAPQLLISVQTPTEVRDALQAGVDFIDVKDPRRGSLGAPSMDTLAAVVAQVKQHNVANAIVSAALGELRDASLDALTALPAGIQLVKFGLSGLRQRPDWPVLLQTIRGALRDDVQLVAVAYADAELADAPNWQEVLQAAVCQGIGTLLVDTFDKSAGQLMDWLPPEQLVNVITTAHQQGIRVALAGSLAIADVPILAPLQPDILAFRTAATRGARTDQICPDAVRRLVSSMAPSRPRQLG